MLKVLGLFERLVHYGDVLGVVVAYLPLVHWLVRFHCWFDLNLLLLEADAQVHFRGVAVLVNWALFVVDLVLRGLGEENATVYVGSVLIIVGFGYEFGFIRVRFDFEETWNALRK